MPILKPDGMISRFRRGEWDTLESWEFQLLAPLFTVYFTIREFIRDRGETVSAAMAFTTAVSIVPLLSVVMSVLALFGTFSEDSTSVKLLLEQAFPAAAADAAVYLHQFAATSATSVGGISALIFMVVGIALFIQMENTFNGIWGAPSSRKWLRRLLTFYFVITFGPILVSLSVGLSARAKFVLTRMGLEAGFLGTVTPFLLAFILFTVMHRLLPNSRVRWSAAITGGLFTSIAFEWAKWGFNLYVSEVIFESYNTIYGALGLFPIFLLWVYICWMIVLIGAELGYCLQNLRTLIEVDAAHDRIPARQKSNIFNPLVGIEVLSPIVREFKRGNGAISEADLIRVLGYSEVFLRGVLADLVSLDAVRTLEDPDNGERGVIPAKPLEDIFLLPIGEYFFDVAAANSTPMGKVANGYRDLMDKELSGKTASSLVDAADIPAALEPKWDPTKETTRPVMSAMAEKTELSALPDMPVAPDADEEPDLPPETAPSIETPASLFLSAAAAEPDTHLELVEDLDDLEMVVDEAKVPEESMIAETPEPGLEISPADQSEPAIPISDDLVLEESEAFVDEEATEYRGPEVEAAQESVDPDEAEEVEEIQEALDESAVDVSLEIDLGDDWDDFDYDDVLTEASEAGEEIGGIEAINEPNESEADPIVHSKKTQDIQIGDEDSEALRRLREISLKDDDDM